MTLVPPVPRDQARLAVDEIEVKLRRVLHDVLRSHLGDADYWKSAVPGDLQAKIKETNQRTKSVQSRYSDRRSAYSAPVCRHHGPSQDC